MTAKISFVIPAYNEEGVIGHALDNLTKLKRDFSACEVIVLLDGCTDNTKSVVESYPAVDMIIEQWPRKGKTAAVDRLVKAASADIVCIHDADWILVYTPEWLANLVSIFNDPTVGAVADQSPLFEEKQSGFPLHEANGWIERWLHEFKTVKYAQRISGKLYVARMDIPFYTHFFRRQAYTIGRTLCDDGERTANILAKGYKVRIPGALMVPYVKTIYNELTLSSFYRMRLRGHIGRRQVSQLYGIFKAGLRDFYLPFFFYLLKRLPQVKSWKVKSCVFLWWVMVLAAAVHARFIRISTAEGWALMVKKEVKSA